VVIFKYFLAYYFKRGGVSGPVTPPVLLTIAIALYYAYMAHAHTPERNVNKDFEDHLNASEKENRHKFKINEISN